jgi:hypothetical protein
MLRWYVVISSAIPSIFVVNFVCCERGEKVWAREQVRGYVVLLEDSEVMLANREGTRYSCS